MRLYGDFDLRLGDADTSGVWGGSPQPGMNSERHVEDLTRDLIRLGFPLAAVMRTFTIEVENALRDFQMAAAAECTARDPADDEVPEAASAAACEMWLARLEKVPIVVTLRYAGAPTAVANAATRSAIKIWLERSWRNPLFIYAWTRGRRGPGPLSPQKFERGRLGAVNSFRKAPRAAYALDIAASVPPVAFKPPRESMLGNNQKRLSYDGVAPGIWDGGGPSSLFSDKKTAWPGAAITPEALLGEAIDTGSEEHRRRKRSTWRLIAAIAEVEGVGFIDGYNAYDSAVLSIGPFNHTLVGVERRDARKISGGELSAFLSYLNERDPAVMRRFFHACGIAAAKAWGATGIALFDMKRRKYACMPAILTEQDGAPVWTPLPISPVPQKPMEARLQAERFRTWPWCRRFVQAFRDGSVQRAMGAYARLRLRDVLEAPFPSAHWPGQAEWPKDTLVGDIFRSELAVALLIRVHVNMPARVFSVDSSGAITSTLMKLLIKALASKPNAFVAKNPSGWTDAQETDLLDALSALLSVKRFPKPKLKAPKDWRAEIKPMVGYKSHLAETCRAIAAWQDEHLGPLRRTRQGTSGFALFRDGMSPPC